MAIWRLKRTVAHDDGVYEQALRQFGEHHDLPPVQIDRERFDLALAGLAANRTIVPNGLSVEEICQFMDHVAQGK